MTFNRSTIKYQLKKTLPKSLFSFVYFFWKVVALKLVEALDSFRLKKFKKEQLVTLTHSGSTFSLYISPKNGFIDKYIFLYGVYESFILDLIKKHLSSGMTFIDIGANIGQHSMYAAALVGQTGQVHSYEPIPALFNQLSKSSSSNGFETIIHTHNYALGNKEATEKLFVSENIGGSSLVHEDKTTETITVQIKKGDKELLALSRIDIIKIDVEGYEYEVLEGIKESLAKHSPVILLEFSGDFYLKQKNNNGRKILDLLKELEYSLYDIEDSLAEITDNSLFLNSFMKDKKQTNLLCKK